MTELTFDSIREAMDRFPPMPTLRFDLYAHDLGGQAYELNLDPMMATAMGSDGRRLLIVPRDHIERWAYELQRLGVDVRVEPRHRADPTTPQHSEDK